MGRFTIGKQLREHLQEEQDRVVEIMDGYEEMAEVRELKSKRVKLEALYDDQVDKEKRNKEELECKRK